MREIGVWGNRVHDLRRILWQRGDARAAATLLEGCDAPQHAAGAPVLDTGSDHGDWAAQVEVSVSVVICAYTERRWDHLVAAVASLREQTVSPLEVIVVIDHNEQLLARAGEGLAHVTVIPNAWEKGLSGARNSGAADAHGDVVAFLDDDAIAEPGWIAHLRAGYADPRVVGVGGAIEPQWLHGRPAWFPEEFYWVVGCTYRGMPSTSAPVRNVIGANMSVRRDILAELGGFRGAFGCNHGAGDAGLRERALGWLNNSAGDEETEFCIRCARGRPGAVWLYMPTAPVRHWVPEHRVRWTYFWWRCYDEGLGKARLVGMHGFASSLSSERGYVARTLPRGIARGLGDALLRADVSGLARSAAIASGLTATIAGYVVGRCYVRCEMLLSATTRPPIA
jgi:hypothetical protein